MTGSGPSVSSKNVCSVITPDDGGPSDDVGLSDDVGPSDGVTTKRIFEGTLGPEPSFVILLLVIICTMRICLNLVPKFAKSNPKLIYF